VYLIYSEDRLLYVGTASKLGPRLADYFQYDFPGGKGNQCKVVHSGWTEMPRHVVTIAVPEASRFEASALEEYLIGELRPCDNTVGYK
jgi:excinuclease UvrABC nuclease subunit